MSDLAIAGLCVPLAYLLGTFPSAAVVARRNGVDITAAGSGNPGASNAFRVLGWRAGALVFALDAAKGAIATGAGLAIAGRPGGYLLGAAAILGHVLPVTRRFRGGRGVATGAGVVIVLFPLITVGLGAAWFAVARLTRKASLASVAAAVAFPVIVGLAGYPVGDVIVTAVLASLVVLRHAANLRRLVRGEELALDPDAPPPHGGERDGRSGPAR
jgi:acyl phosphate:glycerol-3-phosphate acyltransferase